MPRGLHVIINITGSWDAAAEASLIGSPSCFVIVTEHFDNFQNDAFHDDHRPLVPSGRAFPYRLTTLV